MSNSLFDRIMTSAAEKLAFVLGPSQQNPWSRKDREDLMPPLVQPIPLASESETMSLKELRKQLEERIPGIFTIHADGTVTYDTDTDTDRDDIISFDA